MTAPPDSMASPDMPRPFVYVESLASRRLMRMRALGLLTDEELWPDDPEWSFLGHTLGIRSPEHCRRHGWTKGAAVRLADGRRWYLPRLTTMLAVTTPGLMAAVRSFLRAIDLDKSATDNPLARLRVAYWINEVIRTLIGVNYRICYVYGAGGVPMTPDEQERQHLDALASLTRWPDPDSWTVCGRALVRALDSAPGLLGLAVAFDPMLTWSDSPN